MNFSFSRLLTPETTGLDHLGTLADLLGESVDLLGQLMGADRDTAEHIDSRLGALETTATTTHMALMTSLRSAFITPLPREDLYTMSTWMSLVVGHVATTGFVVRSTQQVKLTGDAMDLLEVLGQQARLTQRAVSQLQEFNDLEETWLEMTRLSRRCERLVAAWVMHDVEESMPRTFHGRREIAHSLEKTLNAWRQMIVHLGAVLVRES